MDWEEHDSIREGEWHLFSVYHVSLAVSHQNTLLLQTSDHKFSMFLIYGGYPIHVLLDKA